MRERFAPILLEACCTAEAKLARIGHCVLCPMEATRRVYLTDGDFTGAACNGAVWRAGQACSKANALAAMDRPAR